MPGSAARALCERDPSDVPAGWNRLVKASMRTAGLHFTACRMLHDYVQHVYAAGR
jgi:hypothetical protein